MRIDHGGGDIVVPQQFLHGADGAVLAADSVTDLVEKLFLG
jgi:hypothetical protein